MDVSGRRASKQFRSSTTDMSEEDRKVYCQGCDQEGPRLPAHGYCTDCKEHLCEKCFTVHNTKHHTLLDAANMPETLYQRQVSSHTSQRNELTTFCLIHSNEKISFFCSHHKKLLCRDCASDEHETSPCIVNHVSYLSGDIIDSTEYQDILKALENIPDNYSTIVEDVKKMTFKSNSLVKDAISDIKKLRHEINERLDKQERLANVIEQKNNTYLKTVEGTRDEITKSLKTLSDKIEQLNTEKQADKLFVELKLAQKTIEGIEENTLLITSQKVKEIKFQPNDTIINMLKTEKSLGTLTEEISNNACSSTQSEHTQYRQTSYMENIWVKTSNNINRCWITGMTLLTPNVLIITDPENKDIKMVDTRSKYVLNQLELDGNPCDVTAVASAEVAVTLYHKPEVQFISTSSNRLTKKKAIVTDGECYGISCNQGKLILTFCNPAKLQIVDMNGTVLTTVNDQDIFRHPWYVTSNRNSIYVSDWEMKTVTRLNWQGEVIGWYRVDGTPYGMAPSDDDNVFVCAMNGNTIEEISGDCSKGKVVLKNLISPYAVCWCGETRKMYHSSFSQDGKRRNLIYVNKLSEI